jgi:glycosyltransferase involved in cell wall biosynthesis
MRLEGNFEGASRLRVQGWARDLDNPEVPVSLVIKVNGAFVGRAIANHFRAPLKQVDGEGRLGFEFDFAEAFSPLERYAVEISAEIDGTPLKNSPRIIEPSTNFNGPARAAMTRIMLSFETDQEAEQRLAFLAEQTDAVLAQQARRHMQSGPNALQARRKQRWRTGVVEEDTPKPRPRALVINDELPVAQFDAGSAALLSHMQSLARCGYDVSFAAANLGKSRAPALDDVSLFCRPWYGSVEEVLASHRKIFDLVYLHRAATADRYAPLVRHTQPAARLIYSVADLGSLRLLRQAEREQRPELVKHSRREAALERHACLRADAVITHSSFEADLLRRWLPKLNLHVVPFAVPSQAVSTPFEARAGLAFIGGYDQAPDVDAAHFLAERIMPELARLDPAICCLLAGSAMPEHVRALQGERVEALGAVDDLSSIFDRVRLTVAPLCFGAGVKGMVLESLAAGIPCICTPIAAEGLDLPDTLAQLVASDAGAIAALIMRLHGDAAFNAGCAEAGLAYIAARNSNDVIDTAMRAATQSSTMVATLPQVAAASL